MDFFASVLRHFTQAKFADEAKTLHPNGKWHYEDYWTLGGFLNRKGQTREGNELLEVACACIDEDLIVQSGSTKLREKMSRN